MLYVTERFKYFRIYTGGGGEKMNCCQISHPSCSAAGAVHGVNARVICLPRIAVPCPHPPPSLLLSFCFVLAGNSAGSFQHILSLSHWKAVSNGGIMVLNVFPFRTKLQNHTQPVGKKGLGEESGSRAAPHPTPPHPTAAYALTFLYVAPQHLTGCLFFKYLVFKSYF